MTEFMSWELITVVILYSLVISCIRLSITIAVLGSKPEFGSSQNKYLGFITIALAMATLFCIPPESSEGSFENAFSSSTLLITF